eukprot:15479587-Alexandrium_andersonii.AAC.1
MRSGHAVSCQARSPARAPHLRRPKFEEFLAACFSFFGTKGARQRFLTLCMPNASAEEKFRVSGMKARRVDWKWGYVEESLVRLSRAVLRLRHLDAG